MKETALPNKRNKAWARDPALAGGPQAAHWGQNPHPRTAGKEENQRCFRVGRARAGDRGPCHEPHLFSGLPNVDGMHSGI